MIFLRRVHKVAVISISEKLTIPMTLDFSSFTTLRIHALRSSALKTVFDKERFALFDPWGQADFVLYRQRVAPSNNLEPSIVLAHYRLPDKTIHPWRVLQMVHIEIQTPNHLLESNHSLPHIGVGF